MSRILYIAKPVDSFDLINYGLIYNFESILDARGIVALGWHVLTLTEWNAVIALAGGITIAGRELKEIGTGHWVDSGGTDSLGFNLRGAGQRTGGVINSFRAVGLWWANSNISTQFRTAAFVSINSSGNQITHAGGGGGWNEAKSIKIAKDSTILSNGQHGEYIGNDLKRYRSTCINSVEYIDLPLAETKFRNGNIIPFEGANSGYFTNSEYYALTTAGCSPPNGNWSNV